MSPFHQAYIVSYLEADIIPCNQGNKPPWTLPAKATYGQYDRKRAERYFGHDLKVPPFFPIVSLLVSFQRTFYIYNIYVCIKSAPWLTISQPQRALTFIKKQYDNEKFETAFLHCFEDMWKEKQIDISVPANLSTTLSKVFTEAQVQEILQAAADPKIKEELTKTTARVVNDLGAFGCPWFWVRNGKGEQEPFFGSDRFHFMWEFLGIPHTRLQLQPKTKL